MSSAEMFSGGSLQNFSDQQNARSINSNATDASMTSHGDKSPASPALDLKCYGATAAAQAGPEVASSATSTASNQPPKRKTSTTSNSPPTVISTPSPTERPESPAQPENLSISHPDKEAAHNPHSFSNTTTTTTTNSSSSKGDKEAMDTGRNTPMPTRDYIPSAHSEAPSTHPPVPSSMLGPSSIYQPFPGVRPGGYYPIEHYFPHPGNPTMSEDRRHAHPHPPPPIAKTPPSSPTESSLFPKCIDHSHTHVHGRVQWQSTVLWHVNAATARTPTGR